MRFLRLLGLLLLAGLVACGFAFYRLKQPYQGFHGETFVEFPRGTGTSGDRRRPGAGRCRALALGFPAGARDERGHVSSKPASTASTAPPVPWKW